MTRIAAVHPVLPAHRYAQEEITQRFADVCLQPGDPHDLLRRLHASAGVATRHFALPIDRYAQLADFGEANDAFIDIAVELGAAAVVGALDRAGLRPDDVDVVMSTTVTGVAVPSIESRIAAVVGLRHDVKRVPLFGLGCMAGAAGLARMHDFLRSSPGEVGVFLSVELCSLTVQRNDSSTANLVASGLFGDGAAAVVVVGDDHVAAGPEIVDSRAHLYPATERAMGWDVGPTGLTIVLGPEVPDLVGSYLADDVKAFLGDHDLSIHDVAAWVAHPGGPRVLEAVQDSLGITRDALGVTWRSLSEVGNLSSASVLHVLHDTLTGPVTAAGRRGRAAASGPPPQGSPGLLFAMGPGFSSELVLLRW